MGDALARLWFEAGCTVGAGRGDGRPCLPRQLWGAPSWAESPFCPQPLEPDVPFVHKSQFIVGFHCIWPQRSVQGGFAARGGGTGPAGDAGRKHREGNVSFKTAPKPPPPFSEETKVEISGTFPGTVFVLLRTK